MKHILRQDNILWNLYEIWSQIPENRHIDIHDKAIFSLFLFASSLHLRLHMQESIEEFKIQFQSAIVNITAMHIRY